MIEEWKRAWRAAVENFRRELYGGAPPVAGDRLAAMRRDLAAARAELDRIEAELRRVRRKRDAEAEAERACRRRAVMAARIDDDETAAIAYEYADRHAQRRVLLERKLEIVEAEHALHRRELDEMESAVARGRTEADGGRVDEDPLDGPDEQAFRAMAREAREREAEARLSELKRRMR